jgi:chaperonin GroES
MSFNYQPNYDKIIVKPEVPIDKKTKAGIILVHDDRTYKKGTVLAVGPGYIQDGILWPTSTKVGDEVIYTGMAAYAIKIDDVECLIMPDREVMAIVEKEVING